jgi:hypothetical protein
MKKPVLIGLIITLLAAAAVFLYIKNQGKAMTDEDWRNFAVEDTSAITKVFLADKSGNKVTAVRKSPTEWVVNDKHAARKDVVRILLKTIKLVRTKSRVPKNSRENVIKSLSVSGIKVEIYTKEDDDPIKVYYVGSETPTQDGTYMMQEGSPEPFITEIPGFDGYLTPRYPAIESLWRDPALFRYKPDEIKTIRMEYAEFPAESFELVNKGNTVVEIKDLTGKALPNVDRIMAQKYLGTYNNLVFEDEARNLKPAKVDSILSQIPFARMSIVDNKGKTVRLSFFHIKNTRDENDENGKKILYNPDRFHARLNDERKLYVFQYYVWDRALVPITFFAPGSN